MNINYVYVFLDPRKPGIFQYGDLPYVFPYEPFYVGEGKNNRYKLHLRPSCLKADTNNIKVGKIKHIIEAGFNPLDYVILIYNNLTELEAFEKEIFAIKQIGRININTGVLSNLTEGGDGGCGPSKQKGKTYEEIHGKEKAEQLKKQKSERFQGEKNPMWGKISPRRGKSNSEEMRKMLSIANSKPIKQMTVNMELVKIWPSVSSAAEYLKIAITTICNCVSDKMSNRTGGGFRWEYVDKINQKYLQEHIRKNQRYYKVFNRITQEIFYTDNLHQFSKKIGVNSSDLNKTMKYPNRTCHNLKAEIISKEDYYKNKK